jgi:tRNA(Ile)-lysidine synthase
MSGTKKLKDFFIDRKVPAARRMQIPLLVDEESIIWVVGFQISEDYKITDATENIVRIYIENQNS